MSGPGDADFIPPVRKIRSGQSGVARSVNFATRPAVPVDGVSVSIILGEDVTFE